MVATTVPRRTFGVPRRLQRLEERDERVFLALAQGHVTDVDQLELDVGDPWTGVLDDVDQTMEASGGVAKTLLVTSGQPQGSGPGNPTLTVIAEANPRGGAIDAEGIVSQLVELLTANGIEHEVHAPADVDMGGTRFVRVSYSIVTPAVRRTTESYLCSIGEAILSLQIAYVEEAGRDPLRRVIQGVRLRAAAPLARRPVRRAATFVVAR